MLLVAKLSKLAFTKSKCRLNFFFKNRNVPCDGGLLLDLSLHVHADGLQPEAGLPHEVQNPSRKECASGHQASHQSKLRSAENVSIKTCNEKSKGPQSMQHNGAVVTLQHQM